MTMQSTYRNHPHTTIPPWTVRHLTYVPFCSQEYHLQAVLQGTGVAADKEIPVPPPQESTLNYDELYAQRFSKTSTYIRFSQTVEECIGCMYDMTEDDESFLKSYNQKQPAAARLSEDDFEKIMEVFEDTAYVKTPFASVDQTIVSYDDMFQGLHQLDTSRVMPHAKQMYEYWKSRRLALANRPLHPTLKFELHQESDEMDPYVCFRRREVRQTRKTRARDVQSADKLKRLRKELEEGRQLVMAAHARELLKAEMLQTDRTIFEQRAFLKEQKIRLGIRSDDEDLINQKVCLASDHIPGPAALTPGTHSPRRERPQKHLLSSGHLLRSSFACQCARMAETTMQILHCWQIVWPRRRMNFMRTSPRRSRAMSTGIGAILT